MVMVTLAPRSVMHRVTTTDADTDTDVYTDIDKVNRTHTQTNRHTDTAALVHRRDGKAIEKECDGTKEEEGFSSFDKHRATPDAAKQ